MAPKRLAFGHSQAAYIVLLFLPETFFYCRKNDYISWRLERESLVEGEGNGKERSSDQAL
jgi:hypothetical protein